MTYKSINYLPDSLRRVLPAKAQRTYIKAFNSAWDQYGNVNNKADQSREEISHKVAWAAVKQSFNKNYKGQWKRRTNG